MKTNLSTRPLPLSNILFFLLSFLLLSFPSGLLATTVERPIVVSASIGENIVTIYGFTSPFSRVELSSPRVFAFTYSNDSGAFAFNKTLLPKNPSDLCLSSIDDNYRRTFPVCIPPPPPTNYHTDIGPIILSPTLTLDTDMIKPNSTTVASGQSLPNSKIEIYLYQVNSNALVFPWLSQALTKINHPIYAFSLPHYSLTADHKGNYSFNLPTAYSSNYRLYSTAKYLDQQSPKSNTLTYVLPSLFSLFWQQNSWLIITLSIFVLTLFLFFYLIYIYYLAKPTVSYLPAIFSFPLAKPFTSLH